MLGFGFEIRRLFGCGTPFALFFYMKFSLLSAFLTFSALLSCDTLRFDEPPKHSNTALGGFWKLDGAERKEEGTLSWREWNSGWQGYVLYGHEGGMALHLSPVGYEDFDGEVRNFKSDQPDSVLRHLALAYSYIGSYAVDYERQMVTHQKRASNNPSEWGETSIRRYRRSGDTLWLEPLEERNAGMRLRFLKVR